MINNPTFQKTIALLLSVVLLFLPLLTGILSFLLFFAFVPLLLLSKKTELFEFSIYALLVSTIFVLVASFYLLDSGFSVVNTLIQVSLFAIPWFLYQLIRKRHNQKLAYWMLLCSWLSLEWLAGQFWISWQGLQLGALLADTDLFVQWYEWVGVSGGSLWIIILNIQIFRLIFPEKANAGKLYFLNTGLLFFTPLVLSLSVMTSAQKGEKKLLLIGSNILNADCKIDENFLKDNKLNLEKNNNLNCEILHFANDQKKIKAFLKRKTDSTFIEIKPSTYRASDIFGVSKKILTEAKFGNLTLNILGTEDVIRSEIFRMNCRKEQKLILGVSPDSTKISSYVSDKIAKLRAIENRKNIILYQNKTPIQAVYPSGKIVSLQNSKVMFELEKTKDTFFNNYGDLGGRISVFISAWLLLGTIAKTSKYGF